MTDGHENKIEVRVIEGVLAVGCTDVYHIHEVFFGLIFTDFSSHVRSGLRRLAANFLRFS
jgi:hypothetical protein